MRRSGGIALVLTALTIAAAWPAMCAEVRVSGVAGRVIIAPEFYRETSEGPVALEFPAYPGAGGVKPADWFDARITAHPGDTILLEARTYDMALWVFTPDVRITTAPEAEGRAAIQGTLEIDADGVVIDGIDVIGPHAHRYHSGGHGIEINRRYVRNVLIQDCRIERNDWMGVHVIGTGGTIETITIVNCLIADNGSYGVEAQSVSRLVIVGCTITGNNEGVHAGSQVGELVISDSQVHGNRTHDIWRKGS